MNLIAGFQSSNPSLVIIGDVMTQESLGFATRPDSIHLLLVINSLIINNYMRLIALEGRLDEKV